MPRSVGLLLLALAFVIGLGTFARAADEAAQPASPTKPPLGRPAVVGPVHLTFTERSPHSSYDAITKRGGFNAWGAWIPGSRRDKPLSREEVAALEKDEPRWRAAAAAYDLATESFEAFIPNRPRKDGRYGLLVWISPGPHGGVSNAWADVCARHNVIWVGANNSGNDRPPGFRATLALDAAHNMHARYPIDPQRTFIGGFSGGASCSNQLIHSFPDVFRGAFLLAGGGFYGGMVDEKTKSWRSSTLAQPWGNGVDVEDVKANVSLVQMNGTRDPMHTPGGAKADTESLRLDGFRRAANIDVTGVAHTLPPAGWFEKAIRALDAPPATAGPTTAPTTRPDPAPDQIAQAERLLTTARILTRHPKSAKPFLRRILDDYPTTPAATEARKLLDELGEAGDAR